MEMKFVYTKVDTEYSIIQFNTVVAWEKDLYVNVWTSPRIRYIR